MVTQITDGVKVSVQTEYHPNYSNSKQSHYAFTYKVRIENGSNYTVQLLARHWFIYDSCGIITEVKGEGVVGKKPILEPGDVHEYVSGCNIKSDIGKMKGTYLMERVMDGKKFSVIIPEFKLIVPYRLN
jgi:ApaG protein